MERQIIFGIETRRRGEDIEQQTVKGWKVTTDPLLLKTVKEIEFTEMVNRNPVLYKKVIS